MNQGGKTRRNVPPIVWVGVVLLLLFIGGSIVGCATSDVCSCTKKEPISYISDSGSPLTSWYYAGCGKIYYKPSWLGSRFMRLAADRASFVPISATLAKDATHVFAEGRVVADIDVPSLEILWCAKDEKSPMYLIDKNGVYTLTYEKELTSHPNLSAAQLLRRSDCAPYRGR